MMFSLSVIKLGISYVLKDFASEITSSYHFKHITCGVWWVVEKNVMFFIKQLQKYHTKYALKFLRNDIFLFYVNASVLWESKT